MQLDETLVCEQARYIHRTVPTAVGGGLIIVALIVVVFRAVVPDTYLFAWFGGFAGLSVIRMMRWANVRSRQMRLAAAQRWLREATFWAALSGVLWGVGSLFLFPAGQILFQFTFLFALVMMSMAAMFSYAPYYRAFLAFTLPSLLPGMVGLAAQGGPQRIGVAVGVLVMSGVILWSVRAYNRMFLESVRLRFENLELVAQLTVQKDAAVSANLGKSRFLAAASHDLRQPVHALNLYLGAFAQIQLGRHAATVLGKVRQCAQIMDEMLRALLDFSKLDAGAVRAQVVTFALEPLLARTRVECAYQLRVGHPLRSRTRCSQCDRLRLFPERARRLRSPLAGLD